MGEGEGVEVPGWVVVGKQVATEAAGNLGEVHVGIFFSPHISYEPLVSYSTPGLHENDCRPLFFLQRHRNVMTICLF